ncbi:proteoglycan 4 [Drosophila madeirensis]|uniref:Proteoglycan 4 n=1 Tax=Drosophila madeirensis TaxID=30013 RepID=A0AAU9G4B4_DROMD
MSRRPQQFGPRCWVMPLLGLYLLSHGLRCDARAVNVSNTWTMPQEGLNVFYRFFRDRISWFEADAVCQFHHANLVTVDNSFQFDATRDLLRELDVNDIVWIGLMRPQNSDRFMWSNSRPLVADTGYWAESLPLMDAPLCAVIDPIRDYRWHALRCGGPETASFLCEMPVPSWADACILKDMPNLTMQYMADTASIELIRNCQEEGLLRHTCKGKEDRDRAVRKLICPKERLEAQRINDITNSHFKSLQIINNIPTDNNENNDIDLLPNYNGRRGMAINIEVAPQLVPTLAPFPLNERFGLAEFMQADAPGSVSLSGLYRIPDEIPKPVKKSAKKANTPDFVVKVNQQQEQEQQQPAKPTTSKRLMEEMMMGDQPALSDEQLPPSMAEAKDDSHSDASNEIFEPLPHKKKILPQDLRTMPPIVEVTAAKTSTTTTTTTTEIPTTTTTTTTKVPTISTTTATAATTMDHSPMSPVPQSNNQGHPMHPVQQQQHQLAPHSVDDGSKLQQQQQQTMQTMQTMHATHVKESADNSHFIPPMLLVKSHYVPPARHASQEHVDHGDHKPAHATSTSTTTERATATATATETGTSATAEPRTKAAIKEEKEKEQTSTIMSLTGLTADTDSTVASTTTTTTTTTKVTATMPAGTTESVEVTTAAKLGAGVKVAKGSDTSKQEQAATETATATATETTTTKATTTTTTTTTTGAAETANTLRGTAANATTAGTTTTITPTTSKAETPMEVTPTTTPKEVTPTTAKTTPKATPTTTTEAATTTPTTTTSTPTTTASSQKIKPNAVAAKEATEMSAGKHAKKNVEDGAEAGVQAEAEAEAEAATTRHNFLEEETEAPFKPNRRRSLTKPETVSYFKKILG